MLLYFIVFAEPSMFTYQPILPAGGHMTFSFSGDDDVWVFINDQLVLDIGGVHGRVAKTIDLTTMNPKLVAGQIYSLDLFNAERHTGVILLAYY